MLEFNIFWCFLVAIVISLCMFAIEKDAKWSFYRVEDAKAVPVLFEKMDVEMRNIGYGVSSLIVTTGLVSIILSSIIYTLEMYFDVSKDYLTILSSITNHLAVCVVLLSLVTI